MLWHQGESDCLDIDGRAAVYGDRLKRVMEHFIEMARARAQRRWKAFAIIAGQLGDFLKLPRADIVRGHIAGLEAMAKRGMGSAGSRNHGCLYVVGSEGLRHREQLHFDESSVKLGNRYGNALSHLEAFACNDLETRRIFDFSVDNTAAKRFQPRDDRVMGGQSRSMLVYEEPPEGGLGTTLMTGKMVMEGGGFVSLRTDFERGCLARFSGLLVDCCSGEDGPFLSGADEAPELDSNRAQVYRILLRTAVSSARE